MLDGEATEELLMAEMEQCETYLRRFTGLRLQVGKLLLEPVGEVLRVVVRGTSGTETVRAFEDTGSTKSYILKSVVSNLNLQPKRAQKITHCLFGGLGKDEMYYVYDVTILKGNFCHTFEVLDHKQICNEVTPVLYGPWVDELKSKNIGISDFNSEGPIKMLLGADLINKIFTVEAMAEAQMELRGWKFSGKSSGEESVAVLGLGWFPVKDVFTLNPDLIKKNEDVVVTLSMAQKVFDPIGYTCPATLNPIMVTRVWSKNITWDVEVDQDIATAFKQWVKD
ncbi:hypothetical protein JTB14_015104 [Gonioctena quinquepunctata]|nr:hypothetical protein JTB14_015104 [Gonioctena quinquepunctata]